VIEIRAATAGDYDAYAAMFSELGIDDPVPSRTRFAEELTSRILVAVDGDVVGYALFEVLADVGYVRNLVSARTRRRSGIGLALMTAMRERFTAAGATTWCLNVKPGNVPAVALYERCGLRLIYRSQGVRMPREVVLPPPPPDVVLVPVPPETDAIVEPAFGLLRGQLASARSKIGRQVLQLSRGDEVLAVAVFAASFPGAFPCRVSDARHAAALAAHLRAAAPPDAPWVQLGVEGDDGFCAELVRLGGTVHVEIVHMRGAL
jgi:GNAT superfamily N-acetyltransferase